MIISWTKMWILLKQDLAIKSWNWSGSNISFFFKIDHQYYMMEINVNRSDLMKDYYINVPAMLEKPGTVGNRSHSSLSNSYRRAVVCN